MFGWPVCGTGSDVCGVGRNVLNGTRRMWSSTWISTGIGPRILCFFQQSAMMRSLTMYLMIKIGCEVSAAALRRRTSAGSPVAASRSLALRTLP